MDNNIRKKRTYKLPVASLVVGIFGILSTPIILIFIFGFSWALADSGGQPLLSDKITIYGINALGYILGIIPIILGSVDIYRIKNRNISINHIGMDITGIILGFSAILISAYYTWSLLTRWLF